MGIGSESIRQIWEVMHMFTMLIAIMVSQVYTQPIKLCTLNSGIYYMSITVGPPYSQVLHLQIQPTMDIKYVIF